MTITDKDRALLALLSENARMPVAELARSSAFRAPRCRPASSAWRQTA